MKPKEPKAYWGNLAFLSFRDYFTVRLSGLTFCSETTKKFI